MCSVAKSFQDDLNKSTWSKASSMRHLARRASFTDQGERAALNYLVEIVRGKPILDLGVGTGRTISLFKPLTLDYRALDYLPVMVEASRRQHPDASIEVGDARSLMGYPSDHFGLVSFSFNGIDAVSAADRRLVFRAVRRVLAPSGVLFFSTLNLDGPSYRERPWKIRIWRTRNPARYAWRVVRQIAGVPLDMTNWLRIRSCGERGSGYAVAPLSAHHYGVLVHYTTLKRQLEELEAEGFARDPAVFESNRGERVSVGADMSKIDWFHIVAARA
jgi:SAM-dependent methyltransferase